MTAWRIGAVILGLLLVVAYAAGSGLYVSTNAAWYLSLQAPPWQPPNPVFGLAWAYNFVVLGIVGVVMGLRAPVPLLSAYLVVFAATVVLAIGWAYLFYVSHALLAAAVALTLCAILTIVLVGCAFGQQAVLGWVLIPYLLWLVTASSLSWGYWALNRAP